MKLLHDKAIHGGCLNDCARWDDEFNGYLNVHWPCDAALLVQELERREEDYEFTIRSMGY